MVVPLSRSGLLYTLVLAGVIMTRGLASSGDDAEIRFTVTDRVIGHVDARLFGQFLERASWGEPGPEAARVPGTRQLQPSVLARLREMEIPIIRFPGGTDVDYTNWHDLVDNVPGRGAARPDKTIGRHGGAITNNFGYDEFLRLCEDLGAEPLIVLNLREGVVRERLLAEAAQHAAGLVAYCNAPQGAKLPEGMPDWPAVRAKNGRPEPYGVRYFEIGNEIGHFWRQIEALGLGEQETLEWYLTCLETYVEAVREVDPTVEIVVDGDVGRALPHLRARLGDTVQHLAHHRYLPWRWSNNVVKNGEPYPLEEMTAEEIWKAWVGVPEIDPESGTSRARGRIYDIARRDGYKVAITEWNWNGPCEREGAALDSLFAQGIGAAGFLHAFMREGDVVSMGHQSMLVGVSWGINAIRADPSGEVPAYMFPTGQVTMFYSKHHGRDLLEVESEGVPRHAQPYGMGTIRPKTAEVAYIDALATADEDRIYFHAINRSFGEDLAVTLDLSAFDFLGATATQRSFEGRLHNTAQEGEPLEMGFFNTTSLEVSGPVLRVTLPKRSVTILEIPRG